MLVSPHPPCSEWHSVPVAEGESHQEDQTRHYLEE